MILLDEYFLGPSHVAVACPRRCLRCPRRCLRCPRRCLPAALPALPAALPARGAACPRRCLPTALPLTKGVRPTGPALCPSSRQAWGIMPLMAGPTMGTSSIAMHALHTMPGMRLHVYYRGCVLVRCTNSGIPHLGRLDHHEFYLYHPQVGGDAWQPRGGAHARLARRGARREPASGSRWSKQIARSLERKLFPWQHPSSSEHIT